MYLFPYPGVVGLSPTDVDLHLYINFVCVSPEDRRDMHRLSHVI